MSSQESEFLPLVGEFRDTVIIPSGSWSRHLIDALENPDVYVIIVPNEAVAELALSAYDTMQIDREIVVEVREIDAWEELFGSQRGEPK